MIFDMEVTNSRSSTRL